MPLNMLNQKNRIADRKLIEKIGKSGGRYKGKLLTFRFLLKEESPSAFAVAVSKKIAKKAVDRNRVRRQVNEAIRTHLEGLKKTIYALAIGGAGVREAGYADLENDVVKFFNSFVAHAK